MAICFQPLARPNAAPWWTRVLPIIILALGSLKSRPAFNHLPRRFDPDQRVGTFFLTPGIGVKAAAHTLQTFPLNAAILSTYGHGNAPADIELMGAIHQFTQNGKRHILNISQVPEGEAAAIYAQGSRLRASGAINGGKCNVETASALLRLAASND